MTTKEPTFLNAYLVVGSDALKAQAVINRLWARLENLGDLDFNSQILEGTKDIDLALLLDSLNTPPLAAPYRVVVIKEVEKTGAQLVEALVGYLKSPMPSTILVMTAQKLTQQSRLYKAVKALDGKAIIDASERKLRELPAMIQQLAQGYGTHMRPEAAARTADLVGTSTIAINSEVQKLASYVLALGRSEITLDDVNAVVARTNQPTTWNFVDAFCSRDLVRCLEILSALSRETPISLLSLCVVRLRELLQYRSLAARGALSTKELAQALGKQEWQVRKTGELAARFTSQELRTLFAMAAKADMRMKSGGDSHLVLQELILAACR